MIFSLILIAASLLQSVSQAADSPQVALPPGHVALPPGHRDSPAVAPHEGLKIKGSAATLEWLKYWIQNHLVWMNQLHEDKNIIDIIQAMGGDLEGAEIVELSKRLQECPICLERFHESKELIVSGCDHLFCQGCLNNAKRYENLKRYDDVISGCPLCRAPDWSKNTLKLSYTPGETQDLEVGDFSIHPAVNFTPVTEEPTEEPLLGAGLKDLGGVTWYPIVRKKVRVWSGLWFHPVPTTETRLMTHDKAEAYCRKKWARLPSGADFNRLKRLMGYPVFQHLYDTIPGLSEVRSNSFWTSELSIFWGERGEIKPVVPADYKGVPTAAVLCVRPE